MGINTWLIKHNDFQLLVHSLPADCYFNIIRFGSDFKLLFKGSRKNDAKTLRQAAALAGGG